MTPDGDGMRKDVIQILLFKDQILELINGKGLHICFQLASTMKEESARSVSEALSSGQSGDRGGALSMQSKSANSFEFPVMGWIISSRGGIWGEWIWSFLQSIARVCDR